MKKSYFALGLILSLSAPLATQAGQGNDNVLNSRATTMTRQIASKVKLSEGQYVKVRKLNLQMLTAVADLKAQYAADPAALDERMAEVQMHYEWDMAAILWPTQMMAYNQAKSSMTALSIH
ncbi:hypothetical protein [Hymenobacter cavernae]|uniref:Uncharacterized protein n=1 Tax=Hymenobacter cavernae TaxID=2044852 RepID=A0ABQ1U3T3_9BACT|nr:hypothetical protein [Hymenobacter cavernae]GGF09396.1 hypothetical protein GCM10011383_20770 [Hymenobacter cavernae]